ncbi:hypothetical protein AHF37_05794 [Paragonimus kellicotti]|nr:hypothetical protein AHF37_05794 [Paragonimus kellicotti]
MFAPSISGQWKIFSGNELGALFGAWIWSMWRKCNPKADVSKVGMLSSTVSSKILQTIAEKEGFYFEETLTGFKWMGNRADKLAKDGIRVLFAFEEAIVCGAFVLDKDGVGALAVISELIASVYREQSSLQEFLESVYSKYGYHITNNSYYFCYDPLKISAMFERIRHWPDNPGLAGYPQALGRFRIVGIRDLTTGYDTAYPDSKAHCRLLSCEFSGQVCSNRGQSILCSRGIKPLAMCLHECFRLCTSVCFGCLLRPEKSYSSFSILFVDPGIVDVIQGKTEASGQWKIFSGNELGALFGAWIWSMWRKCNPKADVSKVGMLSSTVSSKILQTIAEKEGFYFEETLTGFKWMGNRADKLAKDGIRVLFAFEEAIGFMCGDVVLDKDGVGALAVISELIASVYREQSSLQEFLESVYSNKSSQCITFHFDNDVCLTIRTSGTEPKVKYYSELRSQSNCGRTCAELTAELQELIDLMVDVFCEPEKNGFIARSF